MQSDINLKILEQAIINVARKRGTLHLFDNLDDILKDIKQSDHIESNWQNYKSYNYYVGDLAWQDVLQTSCNILEKEIALFESAV